MVSSLDSVRNPGCHQDGDLVLLRDPTGLVHRVGEIEAVVGDRGSETLVAASALLLTRLIAAAPEAARQLGPGGLRASSKIYAVRRNVSRARLLNRPTETLAA